MTKTTNYDIIIIETKKNISKTNRLVGETLVKILLSLLFIRIIKKKLDKNLKLWYNYYRKKEK